MNASDILAFPAVEGPGNHSGMSLRDWFAGQALISMRIELDSEDADIARWAYALADAMLVARQTENTQLTEATP